MRTVLPFAQRLHHSRGNWRQCEWLAMSGAGVVVADKLCHNRFEVSRRYIKLAYLVGLGVPDLLKDLGW